MKTTISLFLIVFLYLSFVNAQSGLNVNQGNSVSQDGYLTIGNENSNHLALSNLDVQAKDGDQYSTLYLSYFGGDAQIGSSGGYMYYDRESGSTGIGTFLPDARLHVSGTNDASLTSNGVLMIGSGDNAANIILDNNEIMARNNGSASGLFINRDGGNVEFFGNGSGSFIVNDLPFGDKGNMQYESSTGKFFYDNSSRRYKENITSLDDDWTKILNTRPVTYTRPGNPYQWEYGYIAEEIDSIGLTNMVGYDAEGKPEDVRYDKMIIYLVEMLKIQQKEIDILREQMNERPSKNKRRNRRS